MVVGTARIELRIPADSLKAKRRIAKSVSSRIRARYNVAIAEVDDHDVWSTLTLGIACVTTDAGHAHAMLEKVVSAIGAMRLDAEIVDYEVEIV